MNAKINEHLEACNIFSRFVDYSAEPLLQNYGLQTTGLDIVDNIWVELLLACYEAKCTRDGHFIHFQNRIINVNNKYAYIYLIGEDLDCRMKAKPGCWHAPNTELVDLRVSTPSYF